MKLEMKSKRVESVNGVKHYYATVMRNKDLVEVEITKRQFNRTESGERIEICRGNKGTVIKSEV